MTEVLRGQIHALKKAGLSYADISRQTGVAYSTVRDSAIKSDQRGHFKELPRSGRPPKLSARAQDALVRAACNVRDGRPLSLAELGQSVPSHCPRVSGATVKRVLKKHLVTRVTTIGTQSHA